MGLEPATCSACGAELWFVTTKNGKQCPYTADGISHFADCPKAARFKKKGKAGDGSPGV